MGKVVAIGLDGLELSQAERLMAAGRMPALQALRTRGTFARLDHGPAARTGLAWEHFASALGPQEAERASAVEFDPSTYAVWQEGARFEPFWEKLPIRTLIFDPPYVELAKAPTTQGIVGWGAHDPGTHYSARPAALAEGMESYPAWKWTYGAPWSSADACRQMGEQFVAALQLRSREACRLLGDGGDWDLAVIVAGELHGATEGLWHGVDDQHPAARHPSAAAARIALEDIYAALDQLVGDVVAAAGPDTVVVAFAMGGMGHNDSDTASMFLLGELLYRHQFGVPLAESPAAWKTALPHELTIPTGESWEHAVKRCFPESGAKGMAKRVLRRLPAGLAAKAIGLAQRAHVGDAPAPEPVAGRESLAWMPVTRYEASWPKMRAFALPSFYDGRVRINLRGREADGMVEVEDYEAVCDEIESLVRASRHPHTGEEVVAMVERLPAGADPLRLRSDEADLVVVWKGTFNGLRHPVVGMVGPVPFRRTGGHTGPYGTVVVAGPDVESGDLGVLSSFEVPSIVSRLVTGRPAFDPLPA